MKLIILFIILVGSFAQAYSPKVGEKCKYDLYIKGIRAGSMLTHVEGKEKVKGKDAFVLINEIKTEGLISKFYTLVKKSKSYWNHHSLKHEFYVKENNKEKSGIEEFDHSNNTCTYTNGDEKKIFDIPDSIQDQSSVFYFARIVRWEVVEETQVPIGDLGSVRDAYLKKISEENVDGIDTFKIRVIQNEKENFFWIAKNDSREIVKLQVETGAGNLSGNLESCKL